MEQFKYLFTPLKIGAITVRNRLLVSAHSTHFTDPNSGLFSERDAYYFAERAKGGVGLLITGAISVHPTSASHRLYPIGYTKEAVPRYKLVSDMVHEHGSFILAQIRHCGHLTDTGPMDDWRQVWSASAVPAAGHSEIPKEMELEDIREVVEAFAVAAAYAQEGGMDGVQLHAAAGYLQEQFLSPLFNKRTDQYGGDLENRLRFTYEIIDRIRERCGRDFVVGIRITGDQFAPGGLTQQDCEEIAQRLEATEKLDFIDVLGGTALSSLASSASMDFPQGCFAYLASGIKRATNGIPVFANGRINDPVFAEKVLADGHADMVGMVRAHIADPELPNKARTGRLDEIRNCIACNQGCIGRNQQGRPITCIQNAAAGREKELGAGTIKTAERRKLVLVVGGGPAGMEAARVAALRGHRVLLYERAGELGGQVNLAAKVKSREEFGNVARNLIRLLSKLDVEIRLGQEVTPQVVLELNPDAVILATGSTPLRSGFSALRPDLPGIPGAEQDNVVTTFDVLQGGVELGQHVVVIDDEGHARGASTAEFLADQGKKVEIIARHSAIGARLQGTLEDVWYWTRLAKKGVVLSPNTAVREIAGSVVVAYTTYSGSERRIEGVDNVVLCMGNKANNGLYKSLKGQIKELYAVGDCVQPRRVADAIYEAHITARKI